MSTAHTATPVGDRMKLAQEVVSPAEKLALEIAETYFTDSPAAAAKLLKEKVHTHRLTLGEASVLSHVATCMIHSKPWKKTGAA
jgi:hypothetical protein